MRLVHFAMVLDATVIEPQANKTKGIDEYQTGSFTQLHNAKLGHSIKVPQDEKEGETP